MAIQTKDIGTISAKWSTRAQAAGPDYTAGVKAPRNDWAQNTTAAASAWQQGVSDAMSNGRFARGVSAAGTAKWQNGAINKGATRYPQGVAGGQTAYSNGFAPYLQVIASLNLPARGPRGSASNGQRSQAVADALHQKKVNG